MDKAKIDAMRTVLDLIDGRTKHYASVSVGIIHVLGVSVIPTSTLGVAVEGLRELVDAAEAERTAADTMDADGPIGKLIHVLQHVAPDSKPCSDGVRFQASDEGAYYTLYVATVRNAVRAIKALLAAKPAATHADGARALPFDRDTLGRFVREAWVRWAKQQSNPKPAWLLSYDDLGESDKEADRQIGESLARWVLIGDAASFGGQVAPAEPTLEKRIAALSRAEFLGASDWCVQVASTAADTAMGVDIAHSVGNWLIERERADAAKGGA